MITSRLTRRRLLAGAGAATGLAAMPAWAQALGEWLPLTHFLRIVRGVALRAADAPFVAGQLLPILAFAIAAGCVGVLACRLSLRQLR